MKKGVAIAFVCLSIFLLISMPLVSAGWFDDFWAKITGQAVAHTCNDQGNNLMIKERCINPLSEGGITLWDRCSGTNVQQASCVAGDLEDVCEYAIAQSCPTNYECFDGACVEVIAVCGDGIIEVDEECDGINLGEYTSDCETYPGYTGGTLRCSTDCLFDTLKCRGYNPPISICLDTDEINNLNIQGECISNSGNLNDRCFGTNVQQVGCVSGEMGEMCAYLSTQSCSMGYACLEGICVEQGGGGEGTGVVNAFISLATLKDVYFIGSQINLTDPPDNNVRGFEPGEKLIYENSITEPENKGYIIQFEDKSILEKKLELEEKALKNEDSFLIKIPVIRNLILTSKKVSEKIEDHSDKLRKNKEKIKIKISDEISAHRKKSYVIEEEKEFETVFNGIVLDIPEIEAEKIKKLKGVKSVHPNKRVEATLMNSVPLINATSVWNVQDDFGRPLTGQDITIAIMDTGLDYFHPDLGGCFGMGCKVMGGYDFVNNDEDPMDDHGHGTHCAATAAGNGVLKGVAPNASLIAYKVLDSGGSGYSSTIISAIEHSIDPNQDGNISDSYDIISLSLGGWGNPDDPLSVSIDNVVDQGIVAVIAAGNSGPSENTIGSPGTSRKAITVGASNNENVAYFSSRGPVIWEDQENIERFLIKPDVVAPGVNICAAQYNGAWSDRQCLDNNHVAISGTSMATPHIAGVVALVKQAHPNWTSEEIKMALRGSTIDLGYNIFEQGYGRIDAFDVVDFNGIPSIAKLEGGGIIEEEQIDIIGTAKGVDFDRYTLYYGLGENPDVWTEIITSYSPAENNVLYSNFDSSLLHEGNNFFLLSVWNTNGEIIEDRSIAIINNIIMQSPQSQDIYRLGSDLEVVGTIKGNFDNFSVKYRSGGYEDEDPWLDAGVYLTNGGQGEVIEDIIAILDTGNNMYSGIYSIGIEVAFSDGMQTFEYVENIYFDETLKQGWPQHIDFEIFEEISLETTAKSYSIIPNSNIGNEGQSMARTVSGEKAIESLFSNLEHRTYWAGQLEPVVADINNDGYKEIIIYKGGDPPQIIVYDYDGNVLWSEDVGTTEASGGNVHIPLVGDLNNDSYLEIIASNFKNPWMADDFDNSTLYAFDYEGNQLWFKDIPKDYHPTMVLADLDLDGFNEIIVKGNDAKIDKMTIISNEGEIINEWLIPNKRWGASIEGSPAVGNFDDDDDLEIVSASPAEGAGGIWGGGEFLGWNNTGVIYIYNMDGSIVDGWPVYTEGVIFSSPAIGDIDNNGENDIVVGLMYASDIFPDLNYGGIYAFDKNGNILPGWPVELGWEFWSSPSLGDIDNDGDLEIVISKLGFGTYLFHHDGSLVNGWPQSTTWNDYYSSIMGDIDNDGSIDILTTAGNGFYPSVFYHGGVYAWNSYGSLITGFPKRTELDAQAPAVIDDIDQDGKLELIASSDFDWDGYNSKHRGSLYVWELDGNYNENLLPWPTFHRDVERRGAYTLPQDGSLPLIRPQSKIVNNMGHNLTGNLQMILQRDIGEGIWESEIIVNKEVTIPGNSLIKLDYEWNPQNVYIYQVGDYKVYAALFDLEGNIYQTPQGLLETSWEFRVGGVADKKEDPLSTD